MSFFSTLSQRHAFHLVDPSVMPLLSSISALTLTTGSVMYFHGYSFGLPTTLFGFFSILLSMFIWWRDIVREGTLEGCHTNIVQLGLRYGVILFIVSEVMFFFAFFWAFFAASLAPTIEIGNIWPPKGIDVFDPKAIVIKYFNIIIVRSDSYLCSSRNHGRFKNDAVWGLVLTVFLAVIFTMLQAFEYVSANFYNYWWYLWFNPFMARIPWFPCIYRNMFPCCLFS